MTAPGTFRFLNQFTLRPADVNDSATAVAWITADPDHAGDPPDFWLEQKIGRDSYMLEDDQGPLFFFKLHRLSVHVVELHVQFPPHHQAVSQERRIIRGLIKGLAWLEVQLIKAKISNLIFESSYEPLRKFAVNRLGFTLRGKELSKCIGSGDYVRG